MATLKEIFEGNTADIIEATELLEGLRDIPVQNKEVTAGTSPVTVTVDDGYIMESVKVNPTPSQNKTVTPEASSQTVTPDSGKLLSSVVINGDADLKAENIREGVNIFNVIGTMSEGIKVSIDGEEHKEDLTLKSSKQNIDLGTPQHGVYKGCAVVLNNEIHTLGGSSSSTYKNHYKWDGSSWKSVSTLPYNFCQGCAVVLNNEIHIMGTTIGSSNCTLHYKWDGSSWTKVSTLPYDFYQGCAVVANNEIHILGSNAYEKYTNHYKWDGSSWTKVSTLPRSFVDGCATVLNNEIIIVTATSLSISYKWNGSSWVQFAQNYTYAGCSAFVLNNEVYFVQGKEVSKYAGSYPWEVVTTLPSDVKYGGAVVMDNRVYVLGFDSFYIANQTIYY